MMTRKLSLLQTLGLFALTSPRQEEVEEVVEEVVLRPRPAPPAFLCYPEPTKSEPARPERADPDKKRRRKAQKKARRAGRGVVRPRSKRECAGARMKVGTWDSLRAVEMSTKCEFRPDLAAAHHFVYQPDG